jgi:predicted Zn-dependent peptidase
MANGMQVVLVSQNEQPAISVRMIIRAGAANDPKKQAGSRHAHGHTARSGAR